ncbi:cationic amino acid transporter 4-like [Tubulanus polymorphus]|uniref:cationic amino acid transporter 4-like n=1 Tax=Tubulanus polymorphus TaxID=672921 RepID=UPI003DA466D1
MKGRCCTPIEFWEKLTRTKTLEDDDILKTELRRCISTPWLILFGIGQMTGAGIYVLTGEVVRAKAGPAAPLAYLMAGAVSMISALVYAEFGARVPKSGSSFTFAYVTVGEFLAFVIGWNILLEHCITTAVAARTWSATVNLLTGGWLSNATENATGFFYLAGEKEYPDFLAMGIVILLAIVVVLGVRETVGITAFIAVCNTALAIVIIVASALHADVENVRNTERGGYVPFGAQGLFGGTAMLIYAFYGYDAITIAAEETNEPSTTLPFANISAMVFVTILYVAMSLALSFLSPFYLVDPNAAFAVAFQRLDMEWASIVSNVAALVAITGTCLGNIYSVSRTAFAMSRDGLLFKFMANVNTSTQTPILAVVVLSFVAAVLACIMDVSTLAEFVSIGTLVAITTISACLIVLRYITDQPDSYLLDPRDDDSRELINPTLKMPFVPFLPVLSMLLNVVLLLQLSSSAWIRFCVWMVFGLLLYFAYGIWFSNERGNLRAREDRPKKYPSYGSRASSLDFDQDRPKKYGGTSSYGSRASSTDFEQSGDQLKEAVTPTLPGGY